MAGTGYGTGTWYTYAVRVHIGTKFCCLAVSVFRPTSKAEEATPHTARFFSTEPPVGYIRSVFMPNKRPWPGSC